MLEALNRIDKKIITPICRKTLYFINIFTVDLRREYIENFSENALPRVIEQSIGKAQRKIVDRRLQWKEE